MRYTLVKALVANRTSKGGRVGTPIVAYSLRDNVAGEVNVFTKGEAYLLVLYGGATNCEAKIRKEVIDGEEREIHYLKPNDGTKITDYLSSVE